MQTENLEGQESIFDRDSACGKMSSVLSQVGGTLKRVKKSLGRIPVLKINDDSYDQQK